jgi:hypothetical protein
MCFFRMSGAGCRFGRGEGESVSPGPGERVFGQRTPPFAATCPAFSAEKNDHRVNNWKVKSI